MADSSGEEPDLHLGEAVQDAADDGILLSEVQQLQYKDLVEEACSRGLQLKQLCCLLGCCQVRCTG